MPNPMSQTQVSGSYSPRWFIWAIVFLVVTGVALVSYVVLSDPANEYQNDFPLHRASKK